jgi:hypothetical protein
MSTPKSPEREKKKTTPILNGAYEVIGIVPGPIGTPIGEVDLSRIPVAIAEKLVAMNNPYIRKEEPEVVAKPKVKVKKLKSQPTTVDSPQ